MNEREVLERTLRMIEAILDNPELFMKYYALAKKDDNFVDFESACRRLLIYKQNIEGRLERLK